MQLSVEKRPGGPKGKDHVETEETAEKQENRREDLDGRNAEWTKEFTDMSAKFLHLKSTDDQRQEDADAPVDKAFIGKICRFLLRILTRIFIVNSHKVSCPT